MTGKLTHDPPLGISGSSSINTSTDAAFASVSPPAIRPPRAVLEIPTIETVSTFPSADLPSKSRCARFASSLFLNLRRTVTFSASLGVLCSDDSRIGPHRLKIAYDPIVDGKIVFQATFKRKGVLFISCAHPRRVTLRTSTSAAVVPFARFSICTTFEPTAAPLMEKLTSPLDAVVDPKAWRSACEARFTAPGAVDASARREPSDFPGPLYRSCFQTISASAFD